MPTPGGPRLQTERVVKDSHTKSLRAIAACLARGASPASGAAGGLAVQVRRGISRTPLAPLEVAFCAPFRGKADVLADFHELLSTLEQKVLPARAALPGGPTRVRRDRVVYHAMIRGEPAIGHEQSRANHACIRLNPYRSPP